MRTESARTCSRRCELFMLGRRNGTIALEEHVLTPETSSIFSKYPALVKDHHAMGFCVVV